MRQILTTGRYFAKIYKKRTIKVPLSIPHFTCPNIDGSVARGGCIYCKNESFSPNLSNSKTIAKISPNKPNLALGEQIEAIKTQYFNFIKNLKNSKKPFRAFMPYFQSFSNTYAPLDTLRVLYSEALNLKNSIGISIGTRPDCVDEGHYLLLDELIAEHKKEIWLELGIQSIHDASLAITNRAHTLENVPKIVENLHKIGVKVHAHLIYGLNNEDDKMMIESLKYVINTGFDGLKIHPLYAVKGTKLAKIYENGLWKGLEMDHYAELLATSLKLVPQNMIIQRISAGSDVDLLSPRWCGDKSAMMGYFRTYLKERGILY